MKIVLEGARHDLNEKDRLGGGAEADVYQVGRVAVKIFKKPTDEDYANLPEEKRNAKLRIDEFPSKLAAFPAGLPDTVVSPEKAVFAPDGSTVIGYSMPLVRDGVSLAKFRNRAGRNRVSQNDILQIYLDLHRTLNALHNRGVVVGDFKPENVLVRNKTAYMIDADSMQFGEFLCRMFTVGYLDPKLVSVSGNALKLAKPFTILSDWYAFTAMLFESLTLVTPYGGIYRPKRGRRASEQERGVKGISVFDPEVRYPKPAFPLETLSRDLLEEFRAIFENRVRRAFPRELLEKTSFKRCQKCALEFTGEQCPCGWRPIGSKPKKPAPLNTVGKTPRLKKKIVKLQTVVETKGKILAAGIWQGSLATLIHCDDHFEIETGEKILSGQLDPELIGARLGDVSVIAKRGVVMLCAPNEFPMRLDLSGDEPRAISMFDKQTPILWRDRSSPWQLPISILWASELIRRALFVRESPWRSADIKVMNVIASMPVVGPQAAQLIDGRILRESVPIQIDDQTSYESNRFIWSGAYCLVIVAIKTDLGQGHDVYLFKRGKLTARALNLPIASSWLTKEGIVALLPNGIILSVTTDGIMRVIPDDQGSLVVNHHYPVSDLQPSSIIGLLPGREGIFLVEEKKIRSLTLGFEEGEAPSVIEPVIPTNEGEEKGKHPTTLMSVPTREPLAEAERRAL